MSVPIVFDLIYPMNRETGALMSALAAWRELLWKRGVRDSLNLARRHEDVVRGKPYANPETARGSEVRR